MSESGEIDGAFAMMREQRAGALIVDSSPFFMHHNRIVDRAGKHRLPAIYPFRDYVDAGGLMSYGISITDLWRRAAVYVDKILKGAKPADLPIEQPMTFDLVINLKTAQALGLTLPPTLLFQARRSSAELRYLVPSRREVFADETGHIRGEDSRTHHGYTRQWQRHRCARVRRNPKLTGAQRRVSWLYG